MVLSPRRFLSVGLALVSLVALAGCGSSSTAGTSTTTSTAAATANPAANQLTAWCALTNGEPQSKVMSVMGPPVGHRLDSLTSLFPAGSTLAEWDGSNYVFGASFQGGVLVSAQTFSASDGTPIKACSTH